MPRKTVGFAFSKSNVILLCFSEFVYRSYEYLNTVEEWKFIFRHIIVYTRVCDVVFATETYFYVMSATKKKKK